MPPSSPGSLSVDRHRRLAFDVGRVNFLRLVELKRDGQTLTADEIQSAIAAYTRGDVPDYQMAAMLMAIYFRGLNDSETRALTHSMRDSGEVLAFPPGERPVVDKHSTGGVGDKVSLPLAPLLACLGFRVPMISGRGLGITGGTLDKLESIPGFTTQLDREHIEKQLNAIGVVMAGQTTAMCPADRQLYALRDVTGTVPSIPLITASILSKKLAEGISALILDVKFGSAAFMQTRDQARDLARIMIRIAGESGVKARALLTDMSTPLGRSAGNWLEVKESVACLENRGPADLRELVIDCAAHLLLLSGMAASQDSARAQTIQVLESGAPRRKWDELLVAQGGDLPAFNQKLIRGTTAPIVISLLAERAGFIVRCDARIVGEVVRDLGGGRHSKEAAIDPSVGVDEMVEIGRAIKSGDTLCRIHARNREQAAEASSRLQAAFEITSVPATRGQLIAEII